MSDKKKDDEILENNENPENDLDAGNAENPEEGDLTE